MLVKGATGKYCMSQYCHLIRNCEMWAHRSSYPTGQWWPIGIDLNLISQKTPMPPPQLYVNLFNRDMIVMLAWLWWNIITDINTIMIIVNSQWYPLVMITIDKEISCKSCSIDTHGNILWSFCPILFHNNCLIITHKGKTLGFKICSVFQCHCSGVLWMIVLFHITFQW